jgi:5-methylcytosine-specific restriction enzyme subunit McrC
MIPVHNLYYLLSYAWDLLSESGVAPISCDDSRSAPDMLALMLAGGIESLGRRGLFRDYQPRVEETSRLKGRIDFVASVRRLRHRQATLVCHYDELGTDNLVNGILRTTLNRLLASNSINGAVKQRLRDTAQVLGDVPAISLNRGCFRRAVVTRHHRACRVALLVCELLFELAQPDASGKWHQFTNPWAAEGMPKLFEAFVRNFLKRHLPAARVCARQFAWDAEGDTAEAQSLIPVMKTDVTIEWGDERCVVLDCKFYENSFTESFDQLKLKSANLYQIAAYLHHHPHRAKGVPMHGILLYPCVEASFSHQYRFMSHRLTVASVDLDKQWQTIHSRLLEIVGSSICVQSPASPPPETVPVVRQGENPCVWIDRGHLK